MVLFFIGLINDLTSPDQLIPKATSEIEMYMRTPLSSFTHIKMKMRKVSNYRNIACGTYYCPVMVKILCEPS